VSAAVAGVAATAFSSESQTSELALAIEAIRGALADAGREPADVDGIVRYTYDSSSAQHLIRELGIPRLRYFSEIPFGGSATCAVVAHAAAAIESGLASCVICFRALNGRSGLRLGRAERHLGRDTLVSEGEMAPGGGVLAAPFGFLAPSHAMAMWAHRYQHLHGLTDEQLRAALGAVAVTQRAYAQRNPRAVTRGRTLSYDEYREGRVICTPLRVFDLCRETDGGVALIVTRADDAPEGVRILAARQHIEPWQEQVPVYSEEISCLTSPGAVAELLDAASCTAADVDVLGVYDGTTVNVMLALEDFGFCGRGEAPDLLAAGEHGPGGRIPTNTSGGLLSEGHVHGLNLVMEAVQQLRGRSPNQVDGARTALVTSRSSSMVLAA